MIFSRLYLKITFPIFKHPCVHFLVCPSVKPRVTLKNQAIYKQFARNYILPIWIILLLFGFSIPPCYSSDIRLPGGFAGGMMYKKKVISMRESRFTKMIPQKTDFSCGAAALATILKYGYGENISEQQIIQEMLQISDPEVVKEKGFSLLDLKKYVQSRGMRAHGYKVTIQALEQLKIPVIVLLDTGGYKHFVVVKKARNGKVYVSDPALGNKIIPGNQFTQGWNGIVFAVVGRPFRSDSPLLEINGPFQVEKERMLNSIQKRVDATDFGLIPNQMF